MLNRDLKFLKSNRTTHVKEIIHKSTLIQIDRTNHESHGRLSLRGTGWN